VREAVERLAGEGPEAAERTVKSLEAWARRVRGEDRSNDAPVAG
jgi:hypothetical protein